MQCFSFVGICGTSLHFERAGHFYFFYFFDGKRIRNMKMLLAQLITGMIPNIVVCRTR